MSHGITFIAIMSQVWQHVHEGWSQLHKGRADEVSGVSMSVLIWENR